MYGDFIVWRQIIDKALADKKDFIFVSDDLKEDWILEIHGKKIGPRKELLKEFYDKTEGKSILIYNQKQFLTYARDNENADIKNGTITEVKRVYKEQNNLLKYNINTQYQPIHTLFDNKGLRSSLDSCINLGDNLRLQAKNIQSVLEPYDQTPKYTYTSDYLNSNIFSNQILGIGSDLEKNAYPYLGKIGTKDKD